MRTPLRTAAPTTPNEGGTVGLGTCRRVISCDASPDGTAGESNMLDNCEETLSFEANAGLVNGAMWNYAAE